MTADKMFKKLGYTEIGYKKDLWDRVWAVTYKNNRHYIEIAFDLVGKEICVGTADIEDKDSEPVYIDMDVMQAINQKCKELGWM